MRQNLLLFFFISICHNIYAQNCFDSFLQTGIQFYNEQKFEDAKRIFVLANECDDKKEVQIAKWIQIIDSTQKAFQSQYDEQWSLAEKKFEAKNYKNALYEYKMLISFPNKNSLFKTNDSLANSRMEICKLEMDKKKLIFTQFINRGDSLLNKNEYSDAYKSYKNADNNSIDTIVVLQKIRLLKKLVGKKFHYQEESGLSYQKWCFSFGYYYGKNVSKIFHKEDKSLQFSKGNYPSLNWRYNNEIISSNYSHYYKFVIDAEYFINYKWSLSMNTGLLRYLNNAQEFSIHPILNDTFLVASVSSNNYWSIGTKASYHLPMIKEAISINPTVGIDYFFLAKKEASTKITKTISDTLRYIQINNINNYYFVGENNNPIYINNLRKNNLMLSFVLPVTIQSGSDQHGFVFGLSSGCSFTLLSMNRGEIYPYRNDWNSDTEGWMKGAYSNKPYRYSCYLLGLSIGGW